MITQHNEFYYFMTFKKVKIDQKKEFPRDQIRVCGDDGPDYPLLEFKGFGSRPIKEIKSTDANYPRKVELIQTKLEALIASTANFMWMVFGFPISLFIDENGEEWQFDHRHLLKAMVINNWLHAPIAKYERKIIDESVDGHEVINKLSSNSVMTLSGLFIHSIDGTDNAKMKDYYVISKCISNDNIPRTKKNIEILMDVAGVNQRFPCQNQKGTIGTIRNHLLENKKPSQRVFNTSKHEYVDWVKSHTLFGLNNRSKVDNVLTYHKVLDGSFTYRYANDILKWCFAAWMKKETIRVCASSKAECEVQIESDRQEMVQALKDILDNTVNWYISWVEDRFHNIGMKVTLPKVEMDQLPLELWWIPQIDGEDKDEGIRQPL